MADVQILATGVQDAPLDYTVQPGQEIILKSLYASFDGSAAAAAYLPTVQVISDSGHVVGTYVTQASVAAGGSADVSFGPFLRGASGGASTSGVVFAQVGKTGFKIPAAANDTDLLPWDFFDTSGADISLSAAGRPQINTAGLYRFTWHVDVFDTTWVAPVWLNLAFEFLTGGAQNQASQPFFGINTDYPGWTDSGGAYETQMETGSYFNIVTPPEEIRMRILFVTGAGAHVATNTFTTATFLRVGDVTAGGLN